jgi:hypothetical protein
MFPFLTTFFVFSGQVFVFQEVKVLSTMDHPHIIRALDLGTWEEIRPLKKSGGDFIWLVTGTMEIYVPFHINGMSIIPTPLLSLHHFSRWAHCTTNQSSMDERMNYPLVN